MSTTLVSREIRARRPHVSVALPLGAAMAVAGSLAYVAMNGRPPQEAYTNPIGIAGTMVAVLGCVVLSLALVERRTVAPRWAVVTSAAGIWFAGAVAWSYATVLVAAGTKVSNDEFVHLFLEDAWALGVGMAPKAVLCAVGFLGIAIAGWRARSIPRSVAGLFALAAVASLWPPFPPGLILGSIALVLLARPKARVR